MDQNQNNNRHCPLSNSGTNRNVSACSAAGSSSNNAARKRSDAEIEADLREFENDSDSDHSSSNLDNMFKAGGEGNATLKSTFKSKSKARAIYTGQESRGSRQKKQKPRTPLQSVSRGGRQKKQKPRTPLQSARNAMKTAAKSATKTIGSTISCIVPQSWKKINKSSKGRKKTSETKKTSAAAPAEDTGSDVEYFPNEDEDEDEDEDLLGVDEDINYSISHEVAEDDDIDISLTVTECALETEIDNEGEDKKAPILKTVMREVESLDDTIQGSFAEHYRHLRNHVDNIILTGLKKDIAELIHFENNVDMTLPGEQLEETFNTKREDIGNAMAEALKENGFEHLIPLINLGNKFSYGIVIIFFLHYAPEGSKVSDDDILDYCRVDQCCINLMKKKLLSFLVNELANGSDKMEEWKFGGRSDVDASSKMVCIDLIPFLLQKKDSPTEMVDQYKDVANMFGLESYFDLMIIPYCLLKMHLRLAEKRVSEVMQGEKRKVAQVQVCSSFTAKYIWGLGAGVEKYLTTFESPRKSPRSRLSFGIHPQGLMMGICKNDTLYPTELKNLMSESIVRLFSVVHGFPDEFESSIISIFGNEHAGIQLGMYSLIAKLLDDANALHLDSEAEKSDLKAEEFVAKFLSEEGFNKVVISFVLDELRGITLATMMQRMRKFRAGSRMPFIASMMPLDATLSSLEVHMKKMIDELAIVLCKKTTTVFKKLLKMKQAQERNRERNRLCFTLGWVFNKAGGLKGDGISAVVNHSEFGEYLSKSGLTQEQALESVQELSQSFETREERRRLRYLLAGILSKASEEQDGISAVVNHTEFEAYLSKSGLSQEQAIESLQAISRSFNATFWRNLKLLEEYRIKFGNEDTVVIDGQSILLISLNRNGGEYEVLYKWVCTMNGYFRHNQFTERVYAFKAYERMGSIEQVALAKLDVCFDVDLYCRALKESTANNIRSTSFGAKATSFMAMLG